MYGSTKPARQSCSPTPDPLPLVVANSHGYRSYSRSPASLWVLEGLWAARSSRMVCSEFHERWLYELRAAHSDAIFVIIVNRWIVFSLWLLKYILDTNLIFCSDSLRAAIIMLTCGCKCYPSECLKNSRAAYDATSAVRRTATFLFRSCSSK